MKIFFSTLFLFLNIAANCDAFDHQQWWENWYANGGYSGIGSLGILAGFKANVINNFIAEKKIKSTIEFGSGDGYILNMINYDNYVGLDVSPTAVIMCRDMFKNDLSKQFVLYNPKSFRRSSFGDFELVVCLDVLYHVVDEDAYKKTLDDIFSFSAPYVILYTTLVDTGIPHNSPEIRHRNVLNYLKKYSNYDISIKKQRYPELTRAEFIFLTKKDGFLYAQEGHKEGPHHEWFEGDEVTVREDGIYAESNKGLFKLNVVEYDRVNNRYKVRCRCLEDHHLDADQALSAPYEDVPQ